MGIRPFDSPPKAAVQVPGSKSLTNRLLVLAAIGGAEPVTLTGALRSDDTEVMIDALRRLGLGVLENWQAESVTVTPRPWPQSASTELFVANSGTTMRFLTAMVALGTGRFRLDGIPRMRQRPIEELLEGLRQLGVDAVSEFGNGCPPVVVEARGLHGGHVAVKSDRSSQFLSSLLLVLPFADGSTTIEVSGQLVSEPYVSMTVQLLRRCGYDIETRSGPAYFVPGKQPRLLRGRYEVEPDASAASYFFAAAAITGGTVTISGLSRESLQGDVAFVDLLEQMGCRVEVCSSGITVHGRPLRGIDTDMNAISDTVMTLAAVACFAEGPTVIRNVRHVRHKETDRLSAIANELRKIGADITEFDEGLRIEPRTIHGAVIETYDDHRMAMSMALIGLRIPGIVIRDPGCVAKTYPGFWRDLDQLRATCG
jgi:3-phosphoshikimate 1-carboxyvinyltransferase